MPVLLLWLILFGILLFAAANIFSRFALRAITVVLLAVGVLLLAQEGKSAATARDKPMLEVVLIGAQEAGEDVSRLFGLGDVPLDAAAGVALLLVLVYAYRKAEITNARRSPGPVEVRSFGESSVAAKGGGSNTTAPDPVAMEARMRQRLADANVLPPPSVPGGSEQEQLVEVMQKSPLMDLSGFGKVLAFVARAAFPEVGYHVTATLISETETGGCGVTVSLNDSVSSSTVAVRTFVARTYEQAVDSAAFFVAQNLLHRCSTVPEWQQWWDCLGLAAYQRGRQALRRQDWEEAAKAFAEAGIASPNNVHPPLELAAVYELRDYHHEALVSYFTVLRRLPRLIEARYRLAVAYANAESWDPRMFSEPERRQSLSRAIEEDLRCRPGQAPDANPVPDSISEGGLTGQMLERFYELGRRELESLEKDLALRRFLLWRLRSSHRRLVGRDPLLLSSPRVIGGPRRAMLATTRTAKLSLRLKRHRLQSQRQPSGVAPPANLSDPTSEDQLARRMERVLKQGAGWQAYYNAACFYSTLMSNPPAGNGGLTAWENANDELAARGVQHLDRAFLDPGSEFSPRPAWILDPDHGDHELDKLRRHRRFQDWRREMRFVEGTVQPAPEQRERNLLTEAWYRLAKVATALAQENVWVTLQQTLKSASDVRPVASDWCRREQQLWESLAHVARRPHDLARWKTFEETARRAQPVLCGVDLMSQAPHSSDWHDPLITAAQHRVSWKSLAEAAASVGSVWGDRASRAADSPDDQLRRRLEPWIEDAWGLWECVARCSRRPLNATLNEELVLTVKTFTTPATARRRPPLWVRKGKHSGVSGV